MNEEAIKAARASVDRLEVSVNQLRDAVRTALSQFDLLSKRIQTLITAVGERGFCDGPDCHAEIYWVHHTNGKRAPYNIDGVSHFVTCVNAELFKRKPA